MDGSSAGGAGKSLFPSLTRVRIYRWVRCEGRSDHSCSSRFLSFCIINSGFGASEELLLPIKNLHKVSDGKLAAPRTHNEKNMAVGDRTVRALRMREGEREKFQDGSIPSMKDSLKSPGRKGICPSTGTGSVTLSGGNNKVHVVASEKSTIASLSIATKRDHTDHSKQRQSKMSYTTNEEDQREAARLQARLAEDKASSRGGELSGNRIPNVTIDEGAHKVG